MGFGNTARGAILPITGATATINKEDGTAPPFSIDVQIGQLTYGSHPTTVAPKAGYYTTPILVQVPLNNFVAVLMGVSTRNGQSFPGDFRTSPTSLTWMHPDATRLGGPMHLEAGGREGAATLTYCAGAFVPPMIPGTWTGGCTGFGTPTQSENSMGEGAAQVVNAEVRYTATAGQFQFGGEGTQRQVKRTGGTNDWIGRINFNRFIDAYDREAMALTSIKKFYPTLPQNLVEPVVWGAKFGAVVQRKAIVPGNMVSAFLTLNGAPQDVNTVMITQLGTPTGPGTGMGLAQTSTSWGGPLTTGMVTVQLILTGPDALPSTYSNTGNDQRTVGGQGMVSLVSGSLASRNISGPGTSRTLLTLQLPEPSMALGLIAGVALLVGVSRRRNR
jgi:hypothetical protein